MKKILGLLLLCTLFLTKAFGQESVNNFQVVDSEVVWKNIFETTMTFEQLVEKIKESGLLEKIELGENKIMGELKELEPDIVGAGYTKMNAPIYITRSYVSGFTVIEFKEGKYRVILKRILFSQKFSDPLTKQGEKTSLEEMSLKNGKNEFANSFRKMPSEILNYTFLKKFELTENQLKDDW